VSEYRVHQPVNRHHRWLNPEMPPGPIAAHAMATPDPVRSNETILRGTIRAALHPRVE